ncbi:uncharacterized protein METZ01_LOCUS233012, partial [marine metagenome]
MCAGVNISVDDASINISAPISGVCVLMPQHKNMVPVSQLIVGRDSAQRRLDNFLLSHLKGLPRPRVYRMIRSGEVRVNKRRARPSYRLVSGDVIRVPPFVQIDKGFRTRPQQASSKWITERVIYEDHD